MNYHKEMLNIISNLKNRPKLLLHSCCGPCSTQVINVLKDYFDITVLYYNPNIEPLEEYEKRKSEQIKFINMLDNKYVKFLNCDYDNETFKKRVMGLECEKEGKARCPVCFLLRMEHTCKIAKEKNYEYFGTTLTVSPHKNSKQINILGAFLEKKYKVKYLYSDFKKEDGYLKSIRYSKEYNLYRQDYCGCLYGRDNND